MSGPAQGQPLSLPNALLIHFFTFLYIIDLDSKDWDLHNPAASLGIYEREAVDSSSQAFIGLQHDVYMETATELTNIVIDSLRNRGFRFVTMGECVYSSTADW